MKGFRILVSICVLLLSACSGGSDETPDPDTTQSPTDEGQVTDEGLGEVDATTDEGFVEEDLPSTEDTGAGISELPEVVDEGPPPPEPQTYTMITLNAGLAYGYVPYSEQRREQVMAAISELDADILCLQETHQRFNTMASRSQYTLFFSGEAKDAG